MTSTHEPEYLSDERALAEFFVDVEQHQYELNRQDARRAAALADALAFARRHPSIYALAGDADPVTTALRCAVLEASARFQLAEHTVRNLVHTADEARERMPRLWARAWEGFATIAQLEFAVVLLQRFDDAPDAVDAFDQALHDLVVTAGPSGFRAKAGRLARRLVPQPLAREHADAVVHRRVSVELVEAGMCWVSAYLPAQEGLAIKRRLTSTAKHLQKGRRDGRTRDQVRADLFSGWLRGLGTPTAVKTKVFVTVPLDRLTPEARASVRTDVDPVPGIDLNADPLLLGGEELDDTTAARLLLEAGSFTRVITDPVTGVVLDMDRRARTVTRAQRDWLLLTHRTCTRDGCPRAAVDAEIDHWIEFHRPERGPTDLRNMHPFCEPEHKTKKTTRLQYRRRPDSTVALRSPTGFESAPDIDPSLWSPLERLRRNPTVYGDVPPF